MSRGREGPGKGGSAPPPPRGPVAGRGPEEGRGGGPPPGDLDHLVERCAAHLKSLQDRITAELERLDGRSFQEDLWERPGGGGGRTRVLLAGGVFEKAGVNFSEVHGEVPEALAAQLPGEGRTFHATGLSLVLHPWSPMVPAVHANFRFLRRGSRAWFGGGADLTPFYLWEEDARHFHSVWKEVCDRHDPGHYTRFKRWCDEYFFLPHRGETRGVGGIFFDYLEEDLARAFAFWRDAGAAFLASYLPVLERRRQEPYGPREREFQLWRRGRYAEFNLLYDRGTAFGLKSAGRVESILMSMPPLVRWSYDPRPSGPREVALLEVLRSPREWCPQETKEEERAKP